MAEGCNNNVFRLYEGLRKTKEGVIKKELIFVCSVCDCIHLSGINPKEPDEKQPPKPREVKYGNGGDERMKEVRADERAALTAKNKELDNIIVKDCIEIVRLKKDVRNTYRNGYNDANKAIRDGVEKLKADLKRAPISQTPYPKFYKYTIEVAEMTLNEVLALPGLKGGKK
jgi:hypothetical protein